MSGRGKIGTFQKQIHKTYNLYFFAIILSNEYATGFRYHFSMNKRVFVAIYKEEHVLKEYLLFASKLNYGFTLKATGNLAYQ